MSFNRHDISRNTCQLFGGQANLGYDWWWHSFTARDAETGEEKPFFFEFFLCNPELAAESPVFGQEADPSGLPGAIRPSGRRPSYLMVKAGTWGKDATQLHKFLPWGEIEVDFGCPFSVKAPVSDSPVFELDETHSRGRICISAEEAAAHPEWMCGSGDLEWDLQIEKVTAFNVGYGASRPMRWLQAFEMFWHAEGMKSRYSGTVRWNGRLYNVSPETSYGYADKNWGKGFTSPWVWLSSNNLTSEISGRKLEDSVFDIGGGRPKVWFVALSRKLLSAFWYEGRGYEFNFSKFWTCCRTKFDCRETEDQIIWHVDQRTWRHRMVTDITCQKADMLLVNYESPDGCKRHNRLWNGGNGVGTVELYTDGRLVDRIHAANVGCEYGEYDN